METVTLLESPAGIILLVQAQPGARKNGVTGAHAGRLKVAVTQAPEKGKANQAIVKLLASVLGIKRQQISLLSGETSGQKKFCIAGLTLDELREKVELLVAQRAQAGE